MITPTVGRKVWYRPAKAEFIARNGEQPLDATVVAVHSARSVNLVVFDANGEMHKRPRTLLMQGDEQYDPVTGYCEWMPFQTGQAQALAQQAVQATMF